MLSSLIAGYETAIAVFAVAALVALVGGLMKVRRRKPAGVTASSIAIAAAPASLTPMSPEEHWRRASSILNVAAEHATQMRACQSSAAGHLDSADYALQQLLEELSGVLTIAAPTARDNVHKLAAGPGQQRTTASPRRSSAAAA